MPVRGPSLKSNLKLILCILAVTLTLFAQQRFDSLSDTISSLVQPSMDARCDASAESAAWRCRNAHKHALHLLSKHPLIDGHVDVPVIARYRYANKIDSIPFDQPAFPNGTFPTPAHVDIPRLREGKSGGFFWSSYVVCPNSTTVGHHFENAPTDIAVRDTLEQLDVIKQMTDRFPSDFALVGSVKDARRAFRRAR